MSAPGDDGDNIDDVVKEMSKKASLEPVSDEMKAIFHPFQTAVGDELVVDEDAESAANVATETDRKGLLKRLKDMVGGDLTKIAIPVFYNEPTSFLHKMTETYQFYPLLDEAVKQDDPVKRMLYITALSICRYSTGERTSKPFNPLLGETIEWTTPTTRFVAEQVSHHPPVCAGHMQSKDWEMWEHKEVEAKFTGNAVVVPPLGDSHVKLSELDEHYQWGGLVSCVHNLIVGKLWVDHYGTYEVKCEKTKCKASVTFTQCGWFSRGWHECKATIYDANGKAQFMIGGKWNDELHFWAAKDDAKKKKMDHSKKTLIWKKDFKPSKLSWRGFYKFVDELCELTDFRRKVLPRSDARYRPDILELERFNYRLAGKEKFKLEEKQRQERKKRKAGKLGDWQQRWFKPEDNGPGWVYCGNYWEEREKKLKSLGLKNDCPSTKEF